MFKLDLGKAEEPAIKLPTSAESPKKPKSSRKTSTCALLTTPKPLTVWITTNRGKFLKRWEYQTTRTASWETCMQVKKQPLKLDMEQQTGSKLRKKYIKAAYCNPAYLTYMQSTSWEKLGFIQAGIKMAARNINNLRYANDTTLMAESEEELKSLLMKVKEESEKAGLKLNIQKTKILASSPIISWQIDGETMETVRDFIFLDSKITADGDYNHEISFQKLALWKKSYDQPRQHIKNQRHYFTNKGLSSEGYSFSSSHVWMWQLDCEEGWAPKNWCFWTVVLEKTLESPLDCKEIQPVHS